MKMLRGAHHSASRPSTGSSARLRAKLQASAISPSAPTHAHASVPDMSASVTLDNVRTSLIRQEDTIIFTLIERAQFARNSAVYEPEAIPVPGFDNNGRRYSLLEYILRETEQLHGRVRRYTSPDEQAFYPDDIPSLVLAPLNYPSVLSPAAQDININGKIMELYLQTILPGIAVEGDDFNYGSAATLDVLCLQALSKRIHYGKFVAEAKYRAQPDQYSALIRAGDAAGLMALLTDEAVEQRVVERVRLKAATFGQDVEYVCAMEGNTPAATTPITRHQGAPRYKVHPDIVARLYDDYVMPLTKEVQVAYLLRRLD